MEFILVSDPVIANFVRAELADKKCLNTKVGNFSALIDVLKELWVIPEPKDDFEKTLAFEAASTKSAFWKESLGVDEVNVVRVLLNTTKTLLSFSPLCDSMEPADNSDTRVKSYFNDLVALLNKIQMKPRDYQLALDWYALPLDDAIEELNLHVHESTSLNAWQATVVNRLSETLKPLPEHIQNIFAQLTLKGTKPFQAIGQSIFSKSDPIDTPDSFLAIRCRDPEQEAEVVANRITLLINNGTPPSDIAIVYPSSLANRHFFVNAFMRRGIQLSNFPIEDVVNDWQAQLLRDLIRLQGSSPPPMAFKAVLSNPLMSWSNSFKSNRIIHGDENSKGVADEFVTGLYECIYEKVSDPESLISWLERVGSLLKFNVRSPFTSSRWTELVEELRRKAEAGQNNSFEQLCRRLTSQLQIQRLAVSDTKGFYLNAVLCVTSEEYLPQPVKHLFLIGMNDECYSYTQSAIVTNTLFDLQAWQELGFASQISSRVVELKDSFKNKIGKATQSLTVTACQFNLDGTPSALSDTALDLSLCFQPASDVNPEELFTPLEHIDSEFLQWDHIDLFSEKAPVFSDLEFSKNLLELHRDKEGKQRAETPSSLEKLMISPLDWLLNRQGIEDDSWQVQKLDALLQGNIAHKVFELFKPHQCCSDLDAIYDSLFSQAIDSEAPFLNEPEWRLERIHLNQDIQKSLSYFNEWLIEQKWKIESVELEMKGQLWGIPVRGFSDAVLSNNEKTLILDYKKSKSDARFNRLSNGFDLQTYVYRKLYAQMFGEQLIQSGYYNLNDQILVLDTAEADGSKLKVRATECSLHEQSINARQIIEDSLNDLKEGRVRLNRSGDEGLWKRREVTPYSLLNNSVIRRFTVKDDDA